MTCKVHKRFAVYTEITVSGVLPSATSTRLKQLSANEEASSFRLGRSIVPSSFTPTVHYHLSHIREVAAATVEPRQRGKIYAGNPTTLSTSQDELILPIVPIILIVSVESAIINLKLLEFRKIWSHSHFPFPPSITTLLISDMTEELVLKLSRDGKSASHTRTRPTSQLKHRKRSKAPIAKLDRLQRWQVTQLAD